jgi:hypothetical protein
MEKTRPFRNVRARPTIAGTSCGSGGERALEKTNCGVTA